jgi:hypothetical protein
MLKNSAQRVGEVKVRLLRARAESLVHGKGGELL